MGEKVNKTKSPKRRSPARYHHGDLRRALLDEARAVIAQSGVDGVRLNAIAKTLRVSVAAPFRHFASREALLVAVAEEGALLMVERLEAAAARCTDDPLEAQRARGVAYVRFAVEEPGYFRALVRPEILAASPVLRGLSASQEALLEPILSRGHAGSATKELARRSAGLLAAQALTYGISRMIVDGLLGKLSGDDAERLAYELTGVLGAGLMGR